MMPFCMIGGAMIPLIAMPDWMQTVSHASPVKWAILSLEGGIWRGLSITELLAPCGILVGVGVAFFTAGATIFSRKEA
jgi:ABC-2 type transport system permease protein